jgi:hypothetical protein
MIHGKDTLTLRDRFEIFKQHKDQIKTDFEEFITSPAHPLEVRWQMFKDAPAELSNRDKFIYHGWDEVLDPTTPSARINWVNDLDSYEQGTEISVVDTVEEEFSKPEKYDLNYPGINQEGFLDKIKEQVLKDNIKSFIYDW